MVTIGIIGGNGGMGSLFRRVLSKEHEVLVADTDTELSNEELARRSDIIIIAVPIEKTVGVIESVAPLLTSGQLLMDVTSLKQEPMDAMQKSQAHVIGAHPMFGPSVEGIAHQTVVLTPDSLDNPWLSRVRSFLERHGVRCTITTPEHHDRMMAVIQVLVHFNTIALGRTLSKLGLDIDETLQFTSPIYRMELAMVGRIFAQDPSLYGNIQMRNPQGMDVLNTHHETIKDLLDTIGRKDLDAFMASFNEGAAFFKDFRKTALEESERLLRRLHEDG